MAFIPRAYNDPLCVYSLRLLVSEYGGPIARVVRESDFIEGDVYPDSNNQISYDSTIIVNPNETSALTLGGFLNISNYGNPDGLADVYEARINKLYDQSAAVNHVVAPNFATSLAFVEHTLPAIFPNSTNIHTVNGIPSFLPLSTIPSLTINNVRGRELSFHFVSENTSATTYFGFINLTPYYTVSGVWNESNSSVTTGVTPFSSEAWLMSDNYYNGVLGDVAGEFTRTRIGIPTDDVLICTIQAQLLDTSYTQSDFPDNRMDLSIYSNQWYADIIVYDGYDNIRRLTIEDLLSSGNVNVETKAFTSTLAFTDDGTVDNSFIAQFGTPAAAYSVRSLRGLTGVNGPKILRVRRAHDNIEVDVYTDNSGWVSLDSPIENVYETTINTVNREYVSLATTLGEFVADPSYNNPDNITTTTATVSAWYDQSKVNTDLLPLQITNDEAAAAYSVRLVNPEYNGPLLKVRRSSDNVTKDIYPNANGELDVDAIEQFIQEGVMGPDYTEEYLLDIIPDGETEAPQAAAAYSLRKLKESYTGPLVRVRRTDGIEVDVYPQQDGWFGLESPIENVVESPVEEGDFDGVLTFKYFAQNDNVTVVTWYDQSGSLNDATQDQTGPQPKIYDSLTGVITDNGKPAIYHDGGDGYELTTPLTDTRITAFFAHSIDTSITQWGLISETGGVGSVIPIAKLDDTSNINFGYTLNSTYINNIPFTGNRGDLYTIYSSGARKILSLDFNCLAVDTVGNLFKRSSFIATGKTHEVLIYPSGQTGNRELIEDNINNAFSIYGGWEATVETWYDQSGNGNDASQSDTNAQPTIASGGVVIRENGKPAVQFNGSSSTLKTANLTATAQPTTHFIALKRANTTAGNWYAVDSRTTNQIIGTLSTNAAIYGGAFLTGGALTANQELQSALFNSTSSLLYRNGTQEASGNAGTSSWTGVTLGSFNNEAQSFYSGSIQEYIVYTSNQSDNRPLIEKSINSYYNIYAQDAAIQNVATAQPKIYDGATGVMTENGKLAVQFDSTDDRFVLSTIQATVSNYEIFAVSNSTSTNTSWFFDARSGRLILDAQSTVFSGSGDAYYDGVNNIGNKFTDNIQSIKTWILDSTGNNSAAVYQNGTLWAGSLPYTQKAIDGIIRLGDSSFDNRSWGGRLQELVFYATNPTGNRIDIENNINSAFQIYAANFSSVLDTVPLAKAAYSIRRLTKNYIGPIITVTNGSTTKDFYADFWGNLNVAAIVDHVNGGSYDITKWWDQSGKGNHLESSSNHPTLNISNNQITGITVNSTNSFDNDLNNIAESINASSFPERTDYLLDDYSGAAAAYSLRKIREGYTGPLVRVRRDGGDNAEVDVYPDSNGTISISSSVIDVTEITGTNSSVTSTETTFGDFITGFDGKVVVWYDQSSDFTSDWYTVPNSQNNAVQEVSGSQPKIYDSSTGVTTKDGASSVFFDGVDDGFEMSLGGISVFDNFIVNSSDDFRAIWAYDGSSNYAWFAQNGSTSSPISNYGSPTLYKNGAQITIGTATDLYNDIRTGGLLLLSDLGGSTSSWASYRIADRSLSSQQWSGFVCEMIFYSSDQSTNRTGIETNINDYYSIYPNTNKLVAVYDNSIQRTIALNSASYTDLKEIIHYE